MNKIFARGQTLESHHIYVPREEDHLLLDLALKGSWFNIRGCRTMGKTSLIVRNQKKLEDLGCRVVLVDIGGWDPLLSVSDWFVNLAEEILTDLADRDEPDVDPNLAASHPGRFFKELSQSAEKTLVVLDEVDWLKKLSHGNQIMARLRAAQTYLARTQSSLALCYISLDSLTGIAGADWGAIVKSVPMQDFPTQDSAAQSATKLLAQGFHASLSTRKANNLARLVLTEAGGQPFQTMILASELLDKGSFTPASARKTIDAYLDKQRDFPTELFAQIDEMFLEKPFLAMEALNTYEELLQTPSIAVSLDTLGIKFLQRAGLIRVRDKGAEIKGPVFAKFFDENWIRRTRVRVLEEQRKQRPHPLKFPTNRPRLCILNTGGTVGMVRRNDKVVEPQDENEFLRNYPQLEEIAEIDFEQPFVRDSINVYPEQWKTIAETIYRKRNDGYSGFVIAHGTDTMAFSASAVAFALGQNLSFPVVFVGAQTTPELIHGDSHPNLVRACMVAAKGSALPEVVIAFGTKIFRAVRAQKSDERRFEGFESPSFPPLGEIMESIQLRDDLIRQRQNHTIDIELTAEFAHHILMIQLTPGLEPEFYLPILNGDGAGAPPCKGVILQTLGAGNVANLEPYSFTNFIRQAAQMQIPVLITSPYPWSSDLARGFGPAAEPAQLGAIIGGEMTAAAAATKFRWAIALTEKEKATGTLRPADSIEYVREIMMRNYLGEKDGIFWDPGAVPLRTETEKENG